MIVGVKRLGFRVSLVTYIPALLIALHLAGHAPGLHMGVNQDSPCAPPGYTGFTISGSNSIESKRKENRP